MAPKELKIVYSIIWKKLAWTSLKDNGHYAHAYMYLCMYVHMLEIYQTSKEPKLNSI